MNIFYSDSKTELKLRCALCKNSRYSRVPQDIFGRWTAVCCKLLPHKPLQIIPSLQEARLWVLL